MHQQVIDSYGGPAGPITAVNERGFRVRAKALNHSIFKELKQRV